MIGPIANHFMDNVGRFSPLGALLGSPLDPTGSASVGNSQAAGPAPATGSASFSQITQQISQLLQSIGGGAENNQMLQMMLGLLILLTLLSNSQQPQDAISQLASAGLSGGSPMSGFSSNASITFTKQSFSIQSAPPQTYAPIGGSGGASPPRLDCSA